MIIRITLYSFIYFLIVFWKYLFIYLAALGPSCSNGIFIAACGLFSCGMRDPVPWAGIESGPPEL